MFICKLFLQTRKFLENHSVLMNFDTSGQVFLLLSYHSDGAQGLAQEPQGLWISWVSPGSVAALCCSGTASSGSPESPARNYAFALGKLHRSPVLLPRVSIAGFLLIPITFHPGTTKGKWVIGQHVFEHFQSHGFCMSL